MAEGGTMQYSLDGKTFAKDIPTATDAGDYTVSYKVVGDKNHNSTEAQAVKVTIAAPAPTEAPTEAPTSAPTEAPTSAPTEAPTSAPTEAPTEAPTSAPTEAPEGEGEIDTEVETGDDVPPMQVDGMTEDVAKALATPEELERVKAGEKLVLYMAATNIDDSVSKTDKKLVSKALESGAKVAQYIDFSMFKRVGEDEATRLTDLGGHVVTITITVPKAYRAPKGVKRTFFIVRVHDGVAKVVGSGKGNKISAKTDLFSTYALAYVDEVEPTAKPTVKPTVTPKPTAKPTVKPTVTPKPTVKPTVKPEPKPVVPDYTLLARMTVQGSSKTSLKLTWTKVKGADGYDVFFAKCGKVFKRKGAYNGSVCFTKLDKHTGYKAYVRAWKREGGRKVYIGKASPEVHAITGGYNAKACNAKSIRLNRSALTLKLGRSSTLKASVKGVKSGRSVLAHVRNVRWFSSNVNVATVTSSGKVKATGKGACTIYAITNNGVRVSAKVKVK